MKTTVPGTRLAWAMAFASLILVLATVSASGAPPLPGAIFTTNVNGSRVNQNLFADKCDVYLDGGPGPNAPQGAAGLPDGDYFFQVTDPSGKVLLSTDAVNRRQFHVSGGIITGLSGLGNHGTGSDIDHGATTIQLCPFDDTPNPGGVYKVWVTPVGDFEGDPTKVDNGYKAGSFPHFHGFVPAASKTDNFKVGKRIGLPCLNITKFKDRDADGIFNGSDFLMVWPITITDELGTQVDGTIFTSTNGGGCTIPLAPGTYIVTEAATNGTGDYIVTANILDGNSITPPELTVTVVIKTKDRTLVFGNDFKCGSNPFCP